MFLALRRLGLVGVRRFAYRFWKFQEPDWSKANKPSLLVPADRPSWTGYVNPLYWISWGFEFLYTWLVSRPYQNLGPALPAAIVATFFLVVIFWDNVQGDSWRRNQYRQTLNAALSVDDHETAILACRRLSEWSPNDADLRFRLALIEDARGNRHLGQPLLVDLAINEQHGPSAYWLVREAFKLEDVRGWPAATHQEFRNLVQIAMNKLKDDRLNSVKLLLSSYLAQMGARSESLQLLTEIAIKKPEVHLIGMALALRDNDTALAKEFASGAVSYLQVKLRSDPASVQDRLDLAQALTVLEQEQEAVRQLQAGLQLAPDPRMSEAIGEVLIVFSARLAKNKPPEETLLQRLKVIRNALSFAPNNPAVVDAVVQVILECEKDDADQVETLRQAILHGSAPEAVHFIQGTISLLAGDAETARNHLEIAKETGLNTPGILNNLAMAFLELDDATKFEQALDLSNEALQEMPEHPYLHDTRGRILIKLHRYQEAIPDLEFALRASELAGDVHAQLAIAYQAIGQLDLARQHRELAAPSDAAETPSKPGEKQE